VASILNKRKLKVVIREDYFLNFTFPACSRQAKSQFQIKLKIQITKVITF